ncbi:MAG: hypothetical protein HS128_20060 [Ideonella sp.]|nr:hypothetical protein [Ideonella sp.]MCC7458871.1 hypothetical protein [Nitrospira sp.]
MKATTKYFWAAAAWVAVAGAQAQSPERTVHGVLGVGLTGGGDSLATVVFSNGTTRDVRAGQLVHVFGGAEFRVAPRVTLLATAGYHVDDSGGGNGSLRFSRYPVELLAHVQVAGPLHLGGGVRFIGDAKLDGRGVLGGSRVDFGSTTGAVLEGEYRVTPSIGLKLRYVHETYKTKGVRVDGSHGGFYFSWII